MNIENTLKPTTIPQLVDFLGIKFNAIDEKFDTLNAEIFGVKGELHSLKTEFFNFRDETRVRFKEINIRFNDLEERIFPTSNDREDLESRVSYIEKKLKIKSGK